jgi:hypothetical protein
MSLPAGHVNHYSYTLKKSICYPARLRRPLGLQVQTFWLAFALRLEHTFPRSAEVLHVHPHSPLTKSEKTCLGADSLDVGTRQIVFLVDELIKVDVHVERHLGSVESEDLLLGRLCMAVSVCI